MHDYITIGSDISINHGGVVALASDGEVLVVYYLTKNKKDAKSELGGFRRLVKTSKDVDKASFEMRRLMWLRKYYSDLSVKLLSLIIERNVTDVYLDMEDYA